jgi:large subunit ribosomal protein L13e
LTASKFHHQYPLVLGRGKVLRKGKGFSLGELKEAGIGLEEARRLGVHVDRRRDTIHQENIEVLRDLAELIRQNKLPPPVKSRLAERFRTGSPAKGRVFRGLTSAGRKSRGLFKVKGRRHPQHKWG